MSKKPAPLCQILKPAPWQKNHNPWKRDRNTTKEIDPRDLEALVWGAMESKTPISEASNVIAEKIKKDTRIPMPNLEEISDK